MQYSMHSTKNSPILLANSLCEPVQTLIKGNNTMKSSTTYTTETKLVETTHKVPTLTVTLTLEEVEALIMLGHTSHNSRTDFLTKAHNYVGLPKEKIELCAKLLGDLYFAAADFKKEVYK